MTYDESPFSESATNVTVINNLHSELRQRLESLEGSIERLHGRVSPVLTPEPGALAAGASAPAEAKLPQSMVADSLSFMCSHVVALSARVESITARVEV